MNVCDTVSDAWIALTAPASVKSATGKLGATGSIARRRGRGGVVRAPRRQLTDAHLTPECEKIKLSSENISFIRDVLERDRILRSLEVAEIVHRRRSLAVEFDYTVFPMKVKPCDTLEAKPSYTLVQLKLPAGQHSHLLHVKYPMPRDLADSVTLQGRS